MTLFEKIIAREIPAQIIYEDEYCVAINDIAPKAPTHVLIIPRKVIPRVGDAAPEDQATLGALLLAAGKIAKQLGVSGPGKGFRLVINHGPDAGETVPHMHVHLLAGRALAWPPG
jgi:histidine triad (HIT) family protein